MRTLSFTIQAPPSTLGPAHLRLLSLEEKRLELLPDRRTELLPLYESLLALAERAVQEAKKETEEEGEVDSKEWVKEVVADRGGVGIRMACGPFPLAWASVVAAAKRVLALAVAAAVVAGG